MNTQGDEQHGAEQVAEATPQRSFGTVRTRHSGAGSSTQVESVDLAKDDASLIRRRVRVARAKDDLLLDSGLVPQGSSVTLAQPVSGQSWLTVENCLYLLFLILTLFSRFWDLGRMALHHDESLHATYSWYFFKGNGYTHDPMMHGPFQFHLWGLFQYMFGSSEAAVRSVSATLAIFVVMSPFFLRRYIGRLPALATTFLFLVSPGFLYFGRFAREDAFLMFAEALLLVGLIGYIASRKTPYFYTFIVALSLLFSIKATAYITTLIFIIVLVGLFAWQFSKRLFFAGAAYLGFAAVVFRWMQGQTFLNAATGKEEFKYALPPLPSGSNPTIQLILGYFGSLFSSPLALVQFGLFGLFLVVMGGLVYQKRRAYFGDPNNVFLKRIGFSVAAIFGGALVGVVVLGNIMRAFTPLQIAGGEVFNYVIGGVVGLFFGIWLAHFLARRASVAGEEQQSILLQYPTGSIPNVVGSITSRLHLLYTGLAAFFLIWSFLFTSMYENIPQGLGTGSFGLIGYWLSQHDVRRGNQPWFYYLLLVPLYEILAVFFTVVSIFWASYVGIKGRRDRFIKAGLILWVAALPVLFFAVAQGSSNTGGKLLLGLAAALLVAGFGLFTYTWYSEWRANRGDRASIVPQRVPFSDTRSFLVLLSFVWFLGTFAIYSWAGEKMPWLLVHIAQPAIIAGGSFLGGLFLSIYAWHKVQAAQQVPLAEPVAVPTDALGGRRPKAALGFAAAMPKAISRPRPWVAGDDEESRVLRAWLAPGSYRPLVAYVFLFTILVFGFGVTMAARSYSLTVDRQTPEWGGTAIFPVLILVLTVAYAIWRGVKPALQALLMGIFLVLTIYSVRSAIALSFQNNDVAPKEMAVYTQSSPDVTHVVNQIEQYSRYAFGDNSVRIIYDSDTSWPMTWYMRKFPNARFMPSGPGSLADAKGSNAKLPEFIVVGSSYADPALGKGADLSIDANYIKQKYVLRWWFDESFYRVFSPDNATATQTINAMWGTVATLKDPEYQSKLWRYLLYRDAPIVGSGGSFDFQLLVRRDIYASYNELARGDN